jgi:Glycosyltransferase sugar-binding region containing DXD motif
MPLTRVALSLSTQFTLCLVGSKERKMAKMHFKTPTGYPSTLSSLFLLVIALCFLPFVDVTRPKPSAIIFSSMPSTETSAVARKQIDDVQRLSSAEATVLYLTLEAQRAFLQERSEACSSGGVTAVHAFDALQGKSVEIQTEIFKWCAFATSTHDTAVWLDSSSPILNTAAVNDALLMQTNIAVRDGDVIHGSYMQMTTNESNKLLALAMLRLLLQTDPLVLQTHALLIPKALHDAILKSKADWTYWRVSCRKEDGRHHNHNHLACPTASYCCSVQDGRTTVLMSHHFVVPHQSIPKTLPRKPLNAAIDGDHAETPFESTIVVKELAPSSNGETPNFYQLLERNQCLPDRDVCTRCLREKNGATCDSCAQHCSCYCEKLCRTVVPAKRVVQEWTVSPPLYAKDPSRLIPRIVHQTWFEELDPESYPNMSRLVESFKQSGWEYRFYTDDDAVSFLKRHFPVAVLEAYQALTPGAFKADLFRYCVLLISGGVYADVDVLLESALDLSIPNDVGFMVPIDEVRCRLSEIRGRMFLCSN